MKKMYSGVTSIPQAATRQIAILKAAQEAQTARLGSDTVAMFGTSDPDQAEFLTRPFSRLKMMQTETTGTLAFMPDQNPRLETPYYPGGTPFVLDRAGTGAFAVNIARTGSPPAGYTTNDKSMVQTRVRQYYAGSEEDTGNTRYKWGLTVRAAAKDYAMQLNERLDGDFFPGSIYLGIGRPYGFSFPVEGGNYLYNGDPFTTDGWTGTPHQVAGNSATKPVITSVSPDSMAITAGGGASMPVELEVTGLNFTGAGFVLIGPFLPGPINEPDPPPAFPGIYFDTFNPPGAYNYRLVVDDTTLRIMTPGNIEAGVWDIIVIGNDGQVGVLEKCFTVTES